MITGTILTDRDKQRRYDSLYALMDQVGLEAMFLSGDGPIKFINGEYASGWGVFALVPRQGEPVIFQGNEDREYVLTSVHKNKNDYWVEDIRLMTLQNIRTAFYEKGLDKAKVGFNYHSFPAGLFMALKNMLSEVDMAEISEELRPVMRLKKGNDLKIIEEAMNIVDTCVTELPKILHTGMYEFEVKAAIENIMFSRGADGTLILLNSDKNDISSPAIATDHTPKALSKGDLLVIEITVNYRGCWLQKISIISFGEPDKDIRALSGTVNEAVAKAARKIKPGVNAKDVINEIDDYIEANGFLSPRKEYLSGPQGHLTGFDMDEATFSPFKDFILEEGMLFVLHPGAALPGWQEGKKGVFGPGTMFLVTRDGVKSLSKTGNEICVIDK